MPRAADRISATFTWFPAICEEPRLAQCHRICRSFVRSSHCVFCLATTPRLHYVVAFQVPYAVRAGRTPHVSSSWPSGHFLFSPRSAICALLYIGLVATGAREGYRDDRVSEHQRWLICIGDDHLTRSGCLHLAAIRGRTGRFSHEAIGSN